MKCKELFSIIGQIVAVVAMMALLCGMCAVQWVKEEQLEAAKEVPEVKPVALVETVKATPTPTLTSTPTCTPTPTPMPVPELAGDAEVEMIARTIWGEAGGVPDPMERAAVAWCILNRVDAWGKSITEIVTAPNQFMGYITWGECPEEHLALAADVVERWEREHAGYEDVGRVLGEKYMWFYGDGHHNHFRDAYGKEYTTWDWSLPSPYEEGVTSDVCAG